MEVQVHKPSHKFQAYSALSDVGHGEYIEASIKVPEKLPNFRLALYSHNDNNVGHSHLLYISPLKRDGIKKKKCPPTSTNYYVDFIFDHEINNYFVDLKNHPYLESGDDGHRFILGTVL